MLMRNSICLADDLMGRPDELLRFVELFFVCCTMAPRLWQKIAEEVRGLIAGILGEEEGAREGEDIE